MDAPKTLGNAIAKTRKGAISLNLDRLATQSVSKISSDVFGAFAQKTAELLDPEEARALQAIDTLADTDSRSIGRYATGAGLGAATNPLGKALAASLGVAAQSALRGQPALRNAVRVGKATLLSPRQLTQNATQGAIGGGAFTAIDDHLEAAAARRQVKKILAEEG